MLHILLQNCSDVIDREKTVANQRLKPKNFPTFEITTEYCRIIYSRYENSEQFSTQNINQLVLEAAIRSNILTYLALEKSQIS